MPIMAKAADVLKKLGIDFDMTIISAHREPEEFFAYAKGAEEKGYKVIIAGAGGRQHIFRECAQRFSNAGYRYSNEDIKILEEYIPCTLSCGRQQVFL